MQISSPRQKQSARSSKLATLSLYDNKLSGAIPHSIAFWNWLQLVHIDWRSNSLSGAIPDGSGSWRSLQYFSSEDNKLSGALPAAVDSWRSAWLIHLGGNDLSGSLPNAMPSMKALKWLNVSDNKLSGDIPDAVGQTRMREVCLRNNKLSGKIPNAVSTAISIRNLDSSGNELSGSIPLAISSLKRLQTLHAAGNKLSGSLPQGLALMANLQILDLANNKLSGSIANAVSVAMPFIRTYLQTIQFSRNQLSGTLGPIPFTTIFLMISENQLAGTLSAWESQGLKILVVSGNSLEGTVPAGLMTPGLRTLCCSGRAGTMAVLRGKLPMAMHRAILAELVLSHQNLEGLVPPLANTFRDLALQSNRLRLFSGARLLTTSYALMHNNQMSCNIPSCGDDKVALSLVALGNRMSRLGKLPSWVSPMERDSPSWITFREGSSLLLQAFSASGLFAAVIMIVNLRDGLLGVISRWHLGSGPLLNFSSACSRLLACFTREAFLRLFVLAFLLSWDVYKCPPTLALGSACLRNSTFIHLVGLLLWGQLFFGSHALGCFTVDGPETTCSVAARDMPKALLMWSLILLVMVLLSSICLLCQAIQAVPGFLGDGEFWPRALNTCIGAIQSLLSSIVVPMMGKKFLQHKLLSHNLFAFLVMSNLLMNCLFPAIIIAFLDTDCLANWTRFWDPCTKNPEQFTRILTNDDYKPIDKGISISVMHRSEICEMRDVTRRTSVSRCAEVALLRLQDLWLSKFIMSGLLPPIGVYAKDSLCKRSLQKDSMQVAVNFTTQIAYALITAGHLPLAMPLLWLGMLCTVFFAAVSRYHQQLEHNLEGQSAVLAMALPQVASVLVHAAVASGDAIASIMIGAVLITQMAMSTLRCLAP